MSGHDIYKFKFNEIYKLYLAKINRKGRTKDELDAVISWLTGYTYDEIHGMDDSVDLENFYKSAPNLNPNRNLIKGSICGVKIAEIDEPIMKEIRYLDKLVDELAKGKAIEKILRKW